VIGYLEGGMQAWEAAGLAVSRGDIQDVSSQELSELLKNLIIKMLLN
jgi:3-mercaptopyruvate sulfurtransferase SseA